MYISVPTKELALLLREYSFIVDVSKLSYFAKPRSLFVNYVVSLKQTASSKSISFSNPSLLNEMLDGFKSLWATDTDFK